MQSHETLHLQYNFSTVRTFSVLKIWRRAISFTSRSENYFSQNDSVFWLSSLLMLQKIMSSRSSQINMNYKKSCQTTLFMKFWNCTLASYTIQFPFKEFHTYFLRERATYIRLRWVTRISYIHPNSGKYYPRSVPGRLLSLWKISSLIRYRTFF